jgi:hypothetical protein
MPGVVRWLDARLPHGQGLQNAHGRSGRWGCRYLGQVRCLPTRQADSLTRLVALTAPTKTRECVDNWGVNSLKTLAFDGDMRPDLCGDTWKLSDARINKIAELGSSPTFKMDCSHRTGYYQMQNQVLLPLPPCHSTAPTPTHPAVVRAQHACACRPLAPGNGPPSDVRSGHALTRWFDVHWCNSVVISCPQSEVN